MEPVSSEVKSVPVCSYKLQVLKSPPTTDDFSVPEPDWSKADKNVKLELLLENIGKMQEKINAQLTAFVPEFTEIKEPVQKKPKLAD